MKTALLEKLLYDVACDTVTEDYFTDIIEAMGYTLLLPMKETRKQDYVTLIDFDGGHHKIYC